MAASRRFEGSRGTGGWAGGFTTLEILIVVAIVVVVALVAMPNIMGTIQRYRLRSGADQVMSDLRQIQTLAMTKGVRHRLTVSDCASGPTPCKRYRLERQASGVWPLATSGSGGDVLSEWVDLQSLFGGIRLKSLADGSSGSSLDSVVFDARGASVTAATPYNPINVTITIAHTSGQERSVWVRSAGSVRMP
ncbi:MAG: hypothetical protein HY712_07790 [candidate division NC10 bacterium]|nr:hypothetical protein [candidate division NC10 bacterium]